MTTTTQQLTQGSLRLRPASPSSGPNPQAWKAMVGTKPVSARFSLLPETKPRMSALGTSVDRSDLPGGFCGHPPSAVSAADGSESDVHGDGHCGAAARYSRRRQNPSRPRLRKWRRCSLRRLRSSRRRPSRILRKFSRPGSRRRSRSLARSRPNFRRSTIRFSR